MSSYGPQAGLVVTCDLGYYYDSDREECILNNPAYLSIELYPTTTSYVTLDFTSHTFTKDWTLGFWLRFVYFD
jgi:hypothetical protein